MKSQIGLILLLAMLVFTDSFGQTTYTRLNPLAGDTSCDALAVSNDGTVVGFSGSQAVRWVAGIPLSLGDLAGGSTISAARSVSADGLMIVGNASSANGTEAFLWTSSTGMVGLGDLNGGGFLSSARMSSPSGAWICGNGLVNAGTQAARYSSGTGWLGLGELAGGSYYSQANAVSDDGSVCVGFSHDAEGEQAFRWTAVSGLVALPGLSNGPTSEVRAISADGSMAVGYAGNGGTEPDGKPVRWVGFGQPEILTPDPINGQCHSLSASGDVAGGYYQEGQGFIWTKFLGLVHLQTYLINRGVANIDLFLRGVYGISPNGEYITGIGRTQGVNRGFVARLGFDPRAFPTSMHVVAGFPDEFRLSSLQYSDSSFVSIFSDEVSLNTVLEASAILPSDPQSLTVTARPRAGRPGLAVSLQAYNLITGQFDQKIGGLAPTTYKDLVVNLNAPEAYVDPERKTTWRIRFSPINDEDPAQDSWPVFVDLLNWEVNN